MSHFRRPRLRLYAVGLVVAVAVVLALWRFWPALSGSGSDPGQGLKRAADELYETHADLHRAATAWLAERSRHVMPVQGPEAFRVPHAVAAAVPQLAGTDLEERDLRAAVDHAAEMMYLLYVRREPEAYIRWRLSYGYRFFPIERLRVDAVYRGMLERGAGRRLGPDETDTLPLFRDYWKNKIAPVPPIEGIDQSPEGGLVQVWRGRESLRYREDQPPFRRGIPSQIRSSLHDPQAPDLLRLWRGVRSGIGWPVWFPPPEVEARLGQEGTAFVEVAWVVRFHDGLTLPLSLSLAMDRQTRRWWIMQFYEHNIITGKGAHLEGL
jgi:hypothetical protein